MSKENLFARAPHGDASNSSAGHAQNTRVKAAIPGQVGAHQLMSREPKCPGQYLDVVHGDVADPLLKAADECSVQAGFKGKAFLRKAQVNARHTHIRSED